MPTLRALECLVALADTGSVTEAAARLRASQPAVSHQLAGLERELGAPLVERLPRGVRLTAAGRAALPPARAALAAAEEASAAVRAVARGTAGRLRIGCAETLTGAVLAPVLRAWRRRYPDVEVLLDEQRSADALAERVADGALDLALCPRPSQWSGRVDVVGREEVVVVAGAKDPLAELDVVCADDLAGHPVVGLHPEHGLAGWIEAALAARGAAAEVVVRTGQPGSAAALAVAGLGATLVPTSALSPGVGGAVRRLAPPLSRDLVVLRPGTADVLAGAFTERLVRRGVQVPSALARQLDG
ncbi:LysR family transcriptional regulator [Marmoricola endophyticus]|uniref:LysR family transcriptional regulator n=1 Tax=Marmoricola endophyticus TaxID=2040280 RepID=A0A917BIE1_9ACTN|nr:LysR family transcriptional regulator [Marmoricola endophyticus]GGF46042.1 LysR family transcriptional regulator [Marmoricola endophyticus]